MNVNQLVELYEYKVADLVAKREPRGGKQSVRELRDLLNTQSLGGHLLRRFRQADRNLREKSASPVASMQVIEAQGLEVGFGLEANANPSIMSEEALATPMLEAMAPSADSTMIVQMDDEGEVLQQLGVQAWRADLEDELRDQGKKFRAEASRAVLRLIYSMLHNLDQYSEQSTFPTDLNLSKFKVISKVPEANDTLMRLSDGEVVDDLMRSLSQHVLDFDQKYPKLRLPSSEVLPYLRRVALAVANDHLAGESPPAVSPNPREINNAIDAVRQENTNPEAKQQMLTKLNRQLEQALSKEREIAAAMQNERRNLLGGVDTLFSYLQDRFPARYGGKEKDIPAPKEVIGAQAENRRIDAPAADAKDAVLRLARAFDLELGGVQMKLNNRPEGWALEINQAEYPIQKGARVPVEGREVRVFFNASLGTPYVFLQVRDRDGGGLWNLLALSRCTAILLDPTGNYLNLRLLRAAGSWIRDRRVDPKEFHPETGMMYATAPEENLLRFAKTASEKLLERFRRFPEGMLERSFGTAAESLSEDGAFERAEMLGRVFSGALKPAQAEVSGDYELRRPDQIVIVAYRGEPVTVKVMGRAFTVRADNLGRVFAFAPGGGGRALEDVLSLVVPGGYVLFAREGLRIAVAFLPAQQ
jgi:hypothetical protein